MTSTLLIHDERTLGEAACLAVEIARRRGADQAAASVGASGGMTLRVYDGRAETVRRDGGQWLNVTVVEGGRTARTRTSAFSPEAITRTVERALTIARELQPDPEAGLADPKAMAREDAPRVELFDPALPDAQALFSRALALEAAGGAEARQDAGADVRVEETGASVSQSRWALANSFGFLRSATGSHHAQWCVAVAERDGEKARDSWSSGDRRLVDLAPCEATAKIAIARARGQLGAKPVATRTAPVLIAAQAAVSLLGPLVEGLGGRAQRNASHVLAGALGRQALAGHLDLVEDPLEPFGLASGDFDGDGVGGVRRHIVRAGVVEGYFLAAADARRIAMAPTGNADGVRNLTFSSRLTRADDDFAAMVARLGPGLIVNTMAGEVDGATGGFSMAATGHWVEGGEVVAPVAGVTIAGNLSEMLQSIQAVGADVHRDGPFRSGSILIPSMRIAGDPA